MNNTLSPLHFLELPHYMHLRVNLPSLLKRAIMEGESNGLKEVDSLGGLSLRVSDETYIDVQRAISGVEL